VGSTPIPGSTDVDPLTVKAECKWIRRKGGDKLFSEAGFEIRDLSDADRVALYNFVQLLKAGDAGSWPMLPATPGPAVPLRAETRPATTARTRAGYHFAFKEGIWGETPLQKQSWLNGHNEK